MMYLKGLSISRFKSFKHADLLFDRGFTCIVGPNGSGKSNICDALLFGLGEGTLHRLRVSKLENLISNTTQRKKVDGKVPKAYVKLEFEGDEKLEVIRLARMDGKSAFRINGKPYTRHEALEILKKHKINVDETNTLIQNEVAKATEANPKERRQLIDIAAGIKEFENKRAESLRELDKVSQKIGEAKIMLDQRLGFLKELEKEKEAAEKFLAMSLRLKVLNYNILLARQKDAISIYDKNSTDTSALEKKRNEILVNVETLNAKINSLDGQRQEITKRLNRSTTSVSEINKRLEEVNREVATSAVEEDNAKRIIADGSAEIKSNSEAIENMKKKTDANSVEIDKTKKKVQEIEPLIAADMLDSGVEFQDEDLDTLNKNVDKLEDQLAIIQGGISNLEKELSFLEGKLEDIDKDAADSASRFEQSKKKEKNVREEVAGMEETSISSGKKIRKLEEEISIIKKELEKIDIDVLEAKEQRAINYSREGIIGDALNKAFSQKDGFYGKVSDLCTYSSDDAFAVEAACGSRLNYFVVNTIESASKIIDYLKRRDLGRATFIPVKDLKTERVKRRGDLTALLDVVRFEEPFRNVFEYIFRGTYIIGRIEDAKSAGVGEDRYVTRTGELVEPSGIVSGGGSRKKVSLAVVENKIRELALEKESKTTSLSEREKSLAAQRKDHAINELHLGNARSVLENLQNEIKSLEGIKTDKEKIYVKSNESAIKLKRELEGKINLRTEIMIQLNHSKESAKRVYDRSIELTKKITKHNLNKEQKKELERLRKESDFLKMRVAELQKENQMLGFRREELEKETEAKKKIISEQKAKLQSLLARGQILAKSKKELEVEINNSSDSNKKAYEKLQAFEQELTRLNLEKGKYGATMESIERQINELKMKIGQAKMRMEDITAELASYANENLQIISEKIEEMEKESIIVKDKINVLGPVNLKAPETYLSKKKDVEESEGKMYTLGDEKDSIIKMIEEVDSKKLAIFMEALNSINKNFAKLYNYIFPGSAIAELSNPKDPFNSGLIIKITIDKKIKHLESLSGGEKSFVILMLLFAIHLYKPSSFYIFDEVDAALDKENSKKLSQIIKEMSKSSQFVVVSHNDSLISNADTAIGVTKYDGESKAIGLQVTELINRK